MSNPLKRHFDPIRDVGDETLNFASSIASSVEPLAFYEQGIPQNYDGFYDSPRQSHYHGTSYANPLSDDPVIQPGDSLPEMFGNILLGPNSASQMPTLDLNEIEYMDDALMSWGNDMLLSDSDFSQSLPLSSQETSHSPSLISESSDSRTEDTISVSNNGTICYGTLHEIDVKLLQGDMTSTYSKLENSEAGYQCFKLKAQDGRVILYFNDTGENFGQMRSAESATLSALLDHEFLNIEFEPIVATSDLMEIIARANKPTDAVVKFDINIYGPQSAGIKVGNELTSGKLWLQKPGHLREGVIYDNPHFLRLETNGLPPQSKPHIRQVTSQGSSSRKKREDRLRKMVEEVYDSLHRARQLDAVDGGEGVVSGLLEHQKEALGFMLERETGHISERYRLWETINVEGGNKEYQHRITRAKIRTGIRPSERGGGILADEMGMGKSLSILALIMKTLHNDAEEWVQQQEHSPKVEDAIKRSRSTLVIVPSALLIYNWINEIKEHLRDGVKVIKYHSSDRPKDIDEIVNSDIVVTTYSTLTAEFQVKSSPSLLHCIDWYRVVLDEAHIIRRRATAFYRACDDLHANSRWCLTGTPIQNKLADIGTLFAFIRAEPFTKAATFRKHIEIPFEQSTDEDPKLAKNRLIMLIEALCLRRTRDIIQLPQLRQRVRELSFSEAERVQYDNTKKILLRMIRHRVGEVEESSKFGIFQVNLQMRLLCNHGTFQQPFSWHRRSYRDECESIVSALGQSSEITCAGCQLPMPILGSSPLDNGFYEQCAHVLCSECIEQSNTPSNEGNAQHCPVCVRWLRHAMVESGRMTDGDNSPNCPPNDKAGGDDAYYFNNVGYSTKMNALIKDVRHNMWTTKSIIFSCWTRTLQLLSRYLDDAKIPYVHIDGSSSLKQRQIKLDQFAKDEETPVLIMTTGTGGFGLNITCANRIFIVELQWNPAVESQAIARAIRLGQKNKVFVTRYMIKGTVEEEMGSQQQLKKQLANLGFEEGLAEGDEGDWFE
ncbi:SNF2 family N-terminal domain-containing protein [Trichoderma barbatum]